jgi:hypothetical protein
VLIVIPRKGKCIKRYLKACIVVRYPWPKKWCTRGVIMEDDSQKHVACATHNSLMCQGGRHGRRLAECGRLLSLQWNWRGRCAEDSSWKTCSEAALNVVPLRGVWLFIHSQSKGSGPHWIASYSLLLSIVVCRVLCYRPWVTSQNGDPLRESSLGLGAVCDSAACCIMYCTCLAQANQGSVAKKETASHSSLSPSFLLQP